MPKETQPTPKPVALYPVWPAARDDVDAVNGKLHSQQIVSVPDEEKLLVGRGLEDDDLPAMEFQSAKETGKLIDEKLQSVGGSFLVTPPSISATNSPVAGQTLNLVVSGGKSAFKNDADADIQHYIIVLPDDSEVVSVDGNYDYPIPADTGEGAELRFQAIAVDDSPYQNRSDKTKTELIQFVQGNQAPDVSDLVHNFPATVAAGQTGQMTITGGSDPEGGDVFKQLLNLVGITFDITSNIDDTTTLNWQVDAGLSETDFVTFSIVVEDQDGFKSSNINLTANVAAKPPRIGELVMTFDGADTPPTLKPCENITIQTSEVTDPQGFPVTLHFVSVEGLTFSNEGVINAGESITATLPCVFDASSGTGFTAKASNGFVESDGFYQEIETAAVNGSITLTANGTITVPAGVNNPISASGNAGAGTATKQVQTGTRTVSSCTSRPYLCPPEVAACGYYCRAYGTSTIPVYSTVPASAGGNVVISGAVDKTFYGSAEGVTTPPAETSESFVLGAEDSHEIHVTASDEAWANGAQVTVSW